MNIFWLGLAYTLGTYAGYKVAMGHFGEAVDRCIEVLIKDQYIKTKTNRDGEEDIMKWYEK